ncbi:hypothetical protein [Halobacillus andaensis]|uniref:hypothetical protein n=1 Tax=Halobacillus andaensis TaxID=1176239 RepID=UPI003D738F72
MSEYIYLNDRLSVNKDRGFLSLPFILYNCKPLMPKNRLKRLKVIGKYLIHYRKFKKSSSYSLPIEGDFLLETYQRTKVICQKENIIYTICRDNVDNDLFNTLEVNSTNKMYENILEIDKEKRIILGEFYNGHHPMILYDNKKFIKQLNELFLNLIRSSSSQPVNTIDYVETIKSNIYKILERNSLGISEQDGKLVRELTINLYNYIKNNNNLKKFH